MRVVIIGSGFGGVRAALDLVKVKGLEVQLISDRANFEYYSALYRSATGRSPLEVVIPLRSIFDQDKSKVEVVLDKIIKVDVRYKTVAGESGRRYSYDMLVLATGQVSCHFGVEGIEEYAYSIDTATSAIKLRQHLHAMALKPKRENLNFVIVGGGPSGVELAAELGAYVKWLCSSHSAKQAVVDVILVEAHDRVLPQLDKAISLRAYRRLERLGVKVMLNRRVISFKDGILITEDLDIKVSTVIWTAGFTANPLLAGQGRQLFSLGQHGRAKVDGYLRVKPDIYVIGDSADTKFSGMAQTALHDAKFVARDIAKRHNLRRRNRYKPKRPIYAVPIGGKYAVVQWGSLHISGRLAWSLRRIADLRLMLNLEPFAQAVKTWRSGARRAESSCKLCLKNS